MAIACRRLLALALIAGLTLMNVQAAELHVHDTTGADQAHQHGPASHQHDDELEPESSDTFQVAAVDLGDTLVLVAVVAAPAQTLKPLQAASAETPLFEPATALIVDSARIVARAHGPPPVVQHSLRAPPALLSL